MKTIVHPSSISPLNGRHHLLKIDEGKRTECNGRVRRRHIWIPESTNFYSLQRTRLLVMADDDNISITAKEAGLRFSYGTVLERLRRITYSLTPVAIITAHPEDNRREQYLLSRGWKVQCIRREVVITTSGPTLKGNADFDFVYETARLLTPGHFDAALLLTGDGDLAVAIARCVKRTTPQVRVLTLAMPGGASRRLRTRCDIFDAFIPAGLDICRPWSRRRPGRFQPLFGTVDKPPIDSQQDNRAIDVAPSANKEECAEEISNKSRKNGEKETF